MRREVSDIKVIANEAYSVIKYDNVFIVLKDFNENYKAHILYSQKKQKYYLRGRIIEWLITTPDGQMAIRSYPLKGSISFVNNKDWKMFSTCKYDRAKEKLIMQVHYAWIDYIVLDFNSFDWKK